MRDRIADRRPWVVCPPRGTFEPRPGEAPDVQSTEIRSNCSCHSGIWHPSRHGSGVCHLARLSSSRRSLCRAAAKLRSNVKFSVATIRDRSIRERDAIMFGFDLRQQASVCARLAEECDDRYLAERLRAMASDLLAIANDLEEAPRKQLGYGDQQRLVA